MWQHASSNRAYRLVFNHAKGLWVVAPETAKSQGKAASAVVAPASLVNAFAPRRLTLAVCAGLGLLALPSLSFALDPGALPSGGQVSAGQAQIGQHGNRMTIDQGSQRAIIDWQRFDIGQDAAVRFNQPNARAATLNRVSGGSRSEILGQLSANGQVYLVNGAGVLFGQTAQVNVGGLVASTLAISDQDFLDGNDRFALIDNSTGEVVNQGRITAKGGTVALLGKTVRNDGQINTASGDAVLAAGREVTFAAGADGHLKIAVDASELQLAVHNGGAIVADGGQIVLNAQGANALAAAVVSNSGQLQANALIERNGRILLSADADHGGRVEVAGSLDAGSPHGQGGEIVVSGQQVALSDAHLAASGATGGGTIKVGGDWQGRAGTERARTTTVDATSTLKADATEQGDGGQVVLWSDEATRFAGTISARGSGTGRGGDAEVSGKARLAYTGSADLRGPGGFGTLLLDPYNVTISNGADSNQSGFTASGDDSVINAGTLENALASASVTVRTGTGGNQAGDITVASDVAWNSGSTLTLKAAGDIAIDATLDAAQGSGGKLALEYGQGALASGNTAGYRVSGQVDLQAGQNFSTRLGSDGASLDYTVITQLGAAGSTSGNDLQGISGNLGGRYVLGADIDATATSGWNGGAGFATIGNDASRFTGTLDGLGHVIRGLTIARGGQDYVGLIGYNNGGTLRNLGLEGGSVTGHNSVGGLVGYNYRGTVSNAYATGAVSGSAFVGELVGWNGGTVSNAYATGVVSGNYQVGGLVGYNDSGMVSNAYATGAVTGGRNVGGLVGWNSGTVSNAYATGLVTGSNDVGGLVGVNFGTVSNVYATGAVSGNGGVGGLVGSNFGTVSNAYATGAVSGSGVVGGLVGYNNGGTVTASYWDTDTTGQATSAGGTGLTTTQARIAANYAGWDFAGTWFQTADMRPILRSELTKSADGIYRVGNLHQLQLMAADLAGRYVLTRDIDASATSGTDAAGIWGAGGFVPVGDNRTNSDASRFTGSLDGQGHVIRDLTVAVTRPSYGSRAYAGLFGRTGSTSWIDSLNLYDVDIAATGGAYNYAGGLVGINDGAIRTVSVSGKVRAIAPMPDPWPGPMQSNAGGVAGNNSGTLAFANASVEVAALGSRNNYAGGLVGIDFSGVGTTSIRDSQATGKVTAEAEGAFSFAGGLVGRGGDGGILNSRAITEVEATGDLSYAGGLVGLKDGNITNSHASGSVLAVGGMGWVAGSMAGGLFGDSYEGVITASSYRLANDARIEARGKDSAVNLIGGVVQADGIQSKTLTLKSAGTLDLPDAIMLADNTLVLNAATNVTAGAVVDVDTFILQHGLWRQLAAELPAFAADDFRLEGGSFLRVSGGDGSTANPWQLADVYGLQGVHGFLASHFALGSDIDAGGTLGWNDGLGFSPIGNNTSDPFTGTLDGLGHVISGLTIARSSQSYVGLVGYNNGGTLRNLGLEGGSLSGSNYVGGLVGVNYSGEVSNAYATGVVTGTTHVGGLVGVNFGTVSNAYATGAVTGDSNVGGLVGVNFGSVNNAYATGAVSGNYSVGGLVGLNYGTVRNAFYATTDRNGNAINQGLSGNANGTGKTREDLTRLETFSGWGIDDAGGTRKIWRIYAGHTTPLLRSFLKAVTVDTGTLTGKTYDGQIASGSVTDSDYTTNLDGVVLDGALSYTTASKNANTYRTRDGSLTLSGLWSGQQGYDISYGDASLTIAKAQLTLTASSDNRSYDGSTRSSGAVMHGPLYGSDIITGLSQSFDSKKAGSRTLTVNDGFVLNDGNGGNNYRIIKQSATGQIDKAQLALSGVTAANKSYDGSTAAVLTGIAGVSGLGNDDVAVSHSGTGVFADKNVGTRKDVTLSGYTLSGADADNYTLVMPTGLKADIVPRQLTVTANDASKTYDGQAYTGGNGVSYSGFVNNEGASVLGGSLSYGGDSQNAKNAGSYTLTPGGLTADNYNLTFEDGSLIIARRSIGATLSAADRVYDGTTVATVNGTLNAQAGDTGLIAGDDLSLTASGQFADRNAGTNKTVSYSASLSGSDADNYSFTDASGTTTATISRRDIGATLSAADRVYDGTTAANVSGTLDGRNGDTGLIAGDDLSLTASGQFADRNAGTNKTVNYSASLSGGDAGNYVYTGSANGTTTASISRRDIGATLSAADRVYDGTTAASVSGTLDGRNGDTGLIAGDDLSLTASGTFDDKNAGDGKQVSYSASLSGDDADNYVFTGNANGTTTASIAKAKLTISGTKAQDKTYDGSTVADITAGSLGNLVAGETLGVSATGTFDSANAGARTATASYALSDTSTGLASNYELADSTGLSAEIAKAPLTVTAKDASKTYDGQAYKGGNGVRYQGFVNGEDASVLGGMLVYGGSSQGAVQAGEYRITAGGLDAANYALGYRDGTLAIEARPMDGPQAGDIQRQVEPQWAALLPRVATTAGESSADTRLVGLPLMIAAEYIRGEN